MGKVEVERVEFWNKNNLVHPIKDYYDIKYKYNWFGKLINKTIIYGPRKVEYMSQGEYDCLLGDNSDKRTKGMFYTMQTRGKFYTLGDRLFDKETPYESTIKIINKLQHE